MYGGAYEDRGAHEMTRKKKRQRNTHLSGSCRCRSPFPSTAAKRRWAAAGHVRPSCTRRPLSAPVPPREEEAARASDLRHRPSWSKLVSGLCCMAAVGSGFVRNFTDRKTTDGRTSFNFRDGARNSHSSSAVVFRLFSYCQLDFLLKRAVESDFVPFP